MEKNMKIEAIIIWTVNAIFLSPRLRWMNIYGRKMDGSV